MSDNDSKRIEQLENDLRVQKRITQAAIDSNAHWEDVSEALVWHRPQEEYEGPISERHMASVIATYPQFEKDIRTFVEHWNATPRLTDEMLAAVEMKPDDLERSTRRGMQIVNFYMKLREVERQLAAMTKRVGELEKEINGLRAFKSSVDEALNSGDGSYRP